MAETIMVPEGEKVADVTDEGCKETPKTFLEKIRIISSNITVEPIIFFYSFATMMSGLAVQNLNLDKACRVNLKLNESVCDNLMIKNASGYTELDEQAVQRLVSSLNVYKNILQSLFPTIVLLFVGSWSDRHKRRKPCMIMCLAGDSASCVCYLISTYFYNELPVQFNIFAEAIPQGMMGGGFVMSMALFSYMGDVTTLETRTVRIGAVHIFWHLSVTLGLGVSGVLYQQIGYYGVFLTSLCLYTVAVLYAWFGVKEVGTGDQLNRTRLLRDLFEFKHIKDTLIAVFRKGKRHRRLKICLIMVLVMVIVGPMHGEFNVMYMFLRYKFGWTEIGFSIFITFLSLVNIFGNIFYLLLFSKVFKMDDAIMGTISCISKIIAAFLYGFAPSLLVFCFGVLVDSLGGISFIAIRSIMSKLVPADELGKLNSMFGISEALMPLVYGPLYNIVYKNTLDVFPGAFLVLGGILTVPSVFIFLWLYKAEKHDIKDEILHKEQKEKFLDRERGITPELLKKDY